MRHKQATTSIVEAQDNCAIQRSISFAGMGTPDQQPHFKPIARRVLMATVNTIAKDLGLRSTSVMVIDALLSCLPCKDPETGTDTPINPRTLLTVYAANDTLCFRAKGITERQLRRHLVRLEEVGLIQRKDSANGKRFPVYRGGKVVGAFGIDISPLLEKSEELCTLAKRRREEAEELRGLRSYIQKLRSQCQNMSLSDDLSLYLADTAKIIRRTTTTLSHARAIIKKLTEIIMEANETETGEPAKQAPMTYQRKIAHLKTKYEQPDTTQVSATDGRNVRHKETPKSYTKKITHQTVSSLWGGLKTVSEFYPEIPRSETDLLQVVFEFGRILRIQSNILTRAVSKIGSLQTLMIQDQIAAKADRILDPDAYLCKTMANICRTSVGHGQLSNFDEGNRAKPVHISTDRNKGIPVGT